MAMRAGTRLGAYEIVSLLGAGGMGEVYRARDTRLGREVAIKVVLDAFAADADRVARFQREAKVLASLNHPHIAALYGMEEADGRHFLVMELVEGETLADRLRRGAMPLAETLAIAVQIADALEAAHEKGVVHRDLKPANVKVTPDDNVKVLDFGLAKAVSADSGATRVDANSPTLSMMASQAGVILGTAAYMSPEQAKGFPADHRSDVFSFGTVLFEMLSGRQPFQGETAPDVLASVLVRDPDITELPRDVPPRLADLVRRCLEKHPRRRWQAVGDLRAELETIAAAPRSSAASEAAARKPMWQRALPATLAALVVGAAAWSAAWTLKPQRPPPPVTRFTIALPADQTFSTPARNSIAIAPDGGSLVYVANDQLYLRAFGDFTAIPIAGTSGEHVSTPVFSPDGLAIAFFSGTDKALKRIPATGGAAATLCHARAPFGMSWSEAGIVYAQSGEGRGIFHVVASGGTPETLVALEADEAAYGPQLLPGGKTLLFTVTNGAGDDKWNLAKVVVQSLETKKRTLLLDGAADARYLPRGYLAYAREGVVYLTRFDPGRAQVSGTPVPMIEGVHRSSEGITGLADFAISANGSLAYLAGPVAAASRNTDLVVADLTSGTAVPLNLSGPFQTPRVSPDGTSVAFTSDDGKEASVYVYGLAGTTALRRLTYGGNNRFPLWSGDGKRIVFQSDRGGDRGLFWQAADGSGTAERLTTAAAGEWHVPQSWHGDVLLYDVTSNGGTSLWSYSRADGKRAPIGDVRSGVPSGAVFSPDGHWIAYAAGAQNVTTVFVQPFPPAGIKYELPKRSDFDHPHHPMWSPDGKRLMFVPGPGGFSGVAVTTSPAFAFGNRFQVPRPFQTEVAAKERVYDMRRDGQVIGLQAPETRPTRTGGMPSEIHVVLNWFQELTARLPPDR